MGLVGELKELASLHSDGALTDDEYKEAKAAVIAESKGAAGGSAAPAPAPAKKAAPKKAAKKAQAAAPSPAPAPPPTYQTSGTEQQVTERIVAGMNRRGEELQTEMEKLLDDQDQLQQGQTRLDNGMQELREEKA